MLNAMMKAKKTTGRPVPSEKMTGNASPAEADKVIGISIAKNKAPLYGQKAMAKITPNKNEPSKPLSLNLSDNLDVKLPCAMKFNLITSSIISPIRIIIGPINFSPFPWNNFATWNLLVPK